VDDEAKRDELASLFGLTEGEKEDARNNAGVAGNAIRQQQDDEDFF